MIRLGLPIPTLVAIITSPVRSPRNRRRAAIGPPVIPSLGPPRALFIASPVRRKL